MTINHKISGNGDHWLVFVHGLLCAMDDWRQQLPHFESRYRCLTVDLRGHGESCVLRGPYDPDTLAADVVALLAHYDVEQSVLIGHSMGTRIIAAACMQAPERVSGLVFVDGSKQASGDVLTVLKSIREHLADDNRVKTQISNNFNAMFTDKCERTARDHIISRATSAPAERGRALLTNMTTWDAGRLPCVLSQLNVPLTVIQSTALNEKKERRSLTANETSPYLDFVRNVAPQAAITVVPNVGHFTQLEAAEEVNAAIEATAAQSFNG